MPVDGFEVTYAAVEARERRLDGRVFVGVTSTGIYCRPVCPVPKPKREHVRFFPAAAAAESAGFRACRRCRPEASPDSPDWDVRSDLVGRGLRLIAEGVVDREGIDGLAGRLSVGSRHLHRAFVQELGTGPLSVTRSRRAALAKQLLEQTDLLSTDVAFAAGFSSVRSYHDTLRRVYGRTPTEIRGRRPDDVGSEAPELRLAFRPPLAADRLLAFLAARAIPGVESVAGGRYSRAVRSPAGRPVVLEAEPDPFEPVVALRVIGVGDDVPQLAPSCSRCDACSTSTPTRRRSTPGSAPIPPSAGWCVRRPGRACRGPSTASSSRSERSSASRSRWPAPARPSGASPSGSGRRSRRRRDRSCGCSRRPSGSPTLPAMGSACPSRGPTRSWPSPALWWADRSISRAAGSRADAPGSRVDPRCGGVDHLVRGDARVARPRRVPSGRPRGAHGSAALGLADDVASIRDRRSRRPWRAYAAIHLWHAQGDRRGRLPPVAAQPSVRVAVDGLHPPRWATR